MRQRCVVDAGRRTTRILHRRRRTCKRVTNQGVAAGDLNNELGPICGNV